MSNSNARHLRQTRGRALAFPAAVLVAAAGAGAQCLQQWSGDFGIPAGMNGEVLAALTWSPDGVSTPQLVVTGQFSTGGGAVVNKIARWDGVAWRPFATGLGTNTFADGYCLATWDADGPGPQFPQLLVGGNIGPGIGNVGSGIQRWDGAAWQSLGTGSSNGVNNIVRCMTVWDPDDAGPILPQPIVGGDFTTAGGIVSPRIARWDGAAWQALGAGANAAVCALTTWDPDGAGPQPPLLVAGGAFTSMGGVACARIARFDGLAWQPFGAGMNNIVWTFGRWDAGSGPEMIAGGDFTTAAGAPAERIARWNGTAFVALGSGVNNTVRGLSTWDPDGPGPSGTRLVASGVFTTAGGNPIARVASWNGSSWQGFGSGVNGAAVWAITPFDPDGAGAVYPQLFVAGDFTLAAGQIANRVATWVSHTTPVIITNPAHTSACPASQETFTVRAAAGAFPSYQWRRNGVNLTDGPTASGSSILGSTSIQLTISSSTQDDAGQYDVVVTNTCGSITSSPAPLAFCYANCDCSSAAPELNVQDFTCFLQRYAAGSPYANCDNSTTTPTLNVQDFTCFLQRYAAGCP
jgi:hypothetical protein